MLSVASRHRFSGDGVPFESFGLLSWDFRIAPLSPGAVGKTALGSLSLYLWCSQADTVLPLALAGGAALPTNVQTSP